jgi:hypothetical protein
MITDSTFYQNIAGFTTAGGADGNIFLPYQRHFLYITT